MYLRNFHIRNIGPLAKIDIEFELQEDSTPKPIILVGKNGSGKTYMLSYIADAFFEFAKEFYSDVVNGQGYSSPYFKIITGKDINTQSTGGAAIYLRFQDINKNEELHFGQNIAKEDPKELSNLYGNKLAISDKTTKKSDISKEKSEQIFQENVFIFFPVFRSEIPHWLNQNAINDLDIKNKEKMHKELAREILVIQSLDRNITWLLNVLLDSKLTLEESALASQTNQSEEFQRNIRVKNAFDYSLKKVNEIIQTILEDSTAKIHLGWRNRAGERLSILKNNGRIPSIQQLSTGQLQLFNMFVTIIRHADNNDVSNSFQYEKISGIVVIDEIDAHLHTKHQSEILPKLIKLFPRIQFIVTSHSPLFILGMEKEFGAENIQLIDLPSGMNITSERFGEFEESFNFYKDTAKFEETLHKKIQKTQKPLILVEGETDVKYLKKALELFEKEEWIELVQIDEAGLSEQGGSRNSGQDSLKKGFDFLLTNKKSFQRKVLFLFDCDSKNFTEYKDEHIFKMKVPHNGENTKVLSGVENLLPESLFEINFYSKEVKETGDGGRTTIEKLKKQEFCDFVCNSNDKEIFEKYREFIFPIIEEFLAS
ncbi:AAA family ATPase [Acinetobacter sp. Ver3]|uniref:AAA family ATPase n=1 Tax=Acinetobacter sp. Ver3 TaxID=466088 RepID=UPI00044D1F2F|nr:AAA family ATPase [Acinetobacter sp. Ver3]EZQ12263.1 hypothetical protein CL42_01600 [Acinetobacter sp. Ver3]